LAESDLSVSIPVYGIEDDPGARIVEKTLARIEGIETLKVEFNNQRAIIEATTPDAIQKAVQKIRDIGYTVDSIKHTYPVSGMSCAACASSVESILNSQYGILKANVNFASNTVLIDYIPGIVTLVKLKEVVQSVGFELLDRVSEQTEIETLQNLQQRRYHQLKVRTFWAGAFAIPTMIIAMVYPNIPYAEIIMWILTTPVMFVFGRQFYINAWKRARHGNANMDTLVALSTSIAYLFSIFSLLYPSYWLSHGLEAHVYFEAASVIIAVILIGRFLEERAKSKTAFSIRKLMGLAPDKVTLKYKDGSEKVINIYEVKLEDRIVVKPGEKVPVDGEVLSGISYVDESMISGEPMPVLKDQGSEVYAGTINQKGSFDLIAQKIGEETMLSRIIRLVREAQGSKAPVQKLVDRIAGVFVPTVLIISFLTLILWLILGGENAISMGVLSAVSVLVIACPCALGLATPTAIMVGIGKGAENGILVKDAQSLELTRKVSAVVLDKTGTITEGHPEVIDIFWETEQNEEALESILCGIEKRSEHPIASAIVDYLRKKEIKDADVMNFESITGHGVSAGFNDQTYYVGNEKFLHEHGITVTQDLKERTNDFRTQAYSLIYYADSQQTLAVIAVSDRIKTTSKKAVDMLKNQGLEVYMVTGDNEDTARTISEQAGIENYRSAMLPEDKSSFIKELQKMGETVAMVGDGINDATALAQADVSIAMGKGTDIAMDVSNMTIISSDLLKIPKAFQLSEKTVATVRQNLFWAFIYNIIGIPIAAGLLYPVIGFLLNPMIAGLAMALSSVSVVTNSLRLKTKTI